MSRPVFNSILKQLNDMHNAFLVGHDTLTLPSDRVAKDATRASSAALLASGALEAPAQPVDEPDGAQVLTAEARGPPPRSQVLAEHLDKHPISNKQ